MADTKRKTRRIGDEPIGYTGEGVLARAGGRGEGARRLGGSVQSVAKWGRRIPGPHARSVAIMAGLPLAIVRPDLVRETAKDFAE